VALRAARGLAAGLLRNGPAHEHHRRHRAGRLTIPQGTAHAQTAGLPVVGGLDGLLLPSAVGHALVGFSDTILTTRSLEQADAPAVDTNQESVAWPASTWSLRSPSPYRSAPVSRAAR
jgi:hypothetical protein